MANISPPVQEALSVLERLQADAYNRGWKDAMAAVANFVAGDEPSHGDLPAAGAPVASRSFAERRPRGPNKDSVPSRILALLDAGPLDENTMMARAEEVAPRASAADIKRAIRRLLERNQMVFADSKYMKPGAAEVPRAEEIPESPVQPERSGWFGDSDDREHDAAA